MSDNIQNPNFYDDLYVQQSLVNPDLVRQKFNRQQHEEAKHKKYPLRTFIFITVILLSTISQKLIVISLSRDSQTSIACLTLMLIFSEVPILLRGINLRLKNSKTTNNSNSSYSLLTSPFCLTQLVLDVLDAIIWSYLITNLGSTGKSWGDPEPEKSATSVMILLSSYLCPSIGHFISSIVFQGGKSADGSKPIFSTLFKVILAQFCSVLLEIGKAVFLVVMAISGDNDLNQSIGFSIIMVTGSLRFILHVVDKKVILKDFTMNRAAIVENLNRFLL